MSKRIVRLVLTATSVLAIGASAAFAQTDVELGFSVPSASPGQMVTLFASMANLASDPAVTNFTVTVALGDLSTGPISYSMPIPAGFEKSTEIPFMVPPVPFGGTVNITVAATSGGSTDTATASLTIVTNAATAPTQAMLQGIGSSVGSALSNNSGTTATAQTSLSSVKRLYR